MNLLVRIVVIAVLGAIAQMYFPWYSSIIVAVIVEVILGKGNNTSFFSGFYGVAIPWMILATYIDMKSESILSVRILELFKLPQYGTVMIVLAGLIGGLIGGAGSVAGGWIKDALLRSDGK